MQELFIIKLHEYIVRNNPDLLITLQQEGRVSSYLEEKVATVDDLLNRLQSQNTPSYLIEEQCLEVLTKDLRPSRFNYLLTVLEGDFESDYHRFREGGLLTCEVINLIEACKPVFETLGFTTEAEDNRHLRYAVAGTIKEYLEHKQ